ncbi:Oxysterol-binding protein [Dictyocaulus viviparus]|uniref:Oxysterol-binding protein n=1 Tax=Dictyocaulus viviparus TaxID=29172 RepID=A0A0D8XBW8_DICVI|nr:Oxysterol-binding protein [Dictyocaulus viviparus]
MENYSGSIVQVILPTFILEPRSFLEKLADYYYHADLLAEASAEPDPFNRIVKVVKFYLSGFYKKPKGLKKPYNPILGETFRCRWLHPDGSYTYYIAEQVSHHPPVSSLFVTNRKAGFNVSGTILAKSKYYGNSLSAIMNGALTIALLDRGEKYVVTLPYASCKGIMIGTMTMELGGRVTIDCEKTGYSAILDFLLKPMFGGSMNKITGAVKLGRETLAEIEGYWDGQTTIKDVYSGVKEDLWNPTPEIIKTRLIRHEIDFDSQDSFESKKLWSKVTEAINHEDQYKATEEKTLLEEEQRARARSGLPHQTKYFRAIGSGYEYIHAEYRPWDPHNDERQIEHDYVISTICKVKPAASHKKATSNSELSYGWSDSDDNDSHRKKRKLASPTSNIENLERFIHEFRHRTEESIRQFDNKLDRLASRNVISVHNVLLLFTGFTLFLTVILSYLLRRFCVCPV